MLSSNFLRTIEKEVRRIGEFQVEKQEIVNSKVHSLHGISTKIDEASQKMLVELLAKVTPECGIIAEEGELFSSISNNKLWCIDPLDGTANYVSGLPLWCISLGLLENYYPIFALVYVPFSGDIYCATKTKGAFLNGQRISLKHRPLESILFSFPIERYKSPLTLQRRLKQLGKVSSLVGDIRVFNATALELCYIASGELGGLFVEETAKIWDIAAGMLILEEAQGKITTPSGDKLVFEDNITRGYTVLATGVSLHEPIVRAINE